MIKGRGQLRVVKISEPPRVLWVWRAMKFANSVINMMTATTTSPMMDRGFLENLYQFFCMDFLFIPNLSKALHLFASDSHPNPWI